ncbi:MAG TPA: hypothetical protein VGM60_16060 [Pseudonocardia sp.]|jgi:hypothetical protein|uniref:hypothetical protein n=1 Tax=Pseudonocardia sp. TaxID=60912 RepID=UPI002F3EB9B1
MGILIVVGLVTAAAAALLIFKIVEVLVGSLPVLFVALVLLLGLRRVRRATRRRRSAPRLSAPRPPAPRAAESSWSGAHARFSVLQRAYAEYECNALAVLRLPALADVTVPATARFVDAFAHAQSLDTDTAPPAAHAADYQRAVDLAWRSWRAATEAAERIRLSSLSTRERSSVQRVIKLLTTAEGTAHAGERQSAYAKAREELARLEHTGHLQLPRAAAARLEAAARAGLASPQPAAG